MKRTYSLIIDGVEGSYGAYVPELPTILVTGKTIEELTVCAEEAIRLYLETIRIEPSPESTVREIEVEVPA